jgi:hypothetical protein
MGVPTPGDRVDLHWLPLGAGDDNGLVHASGVLYEAIWAARHRVPRRVLFHSALRVTAGGVVHAIEMAPVWSESAPDRGVVAEGPVGSPLLGRHRLFRYEIRCWAGGSIPDLAHSVGGPRTVSTGADLAGRVVELVPSCPVLTWGRDELGTGEMWNSNSLVSWLLASSGHDLSAIRPPRGGRAPGWEAGLVVAAGAGTKVPWRAVRPGVELSARTPPRGGS